MGERPRSSKLLDGRRVTLADLVDAGLLVPGGRLEFKRPRLGETHYATVTESGGLALDGGQEFRTPSRAAITATGGGSLDGWYAWALPDGRSLDTLRQQLLRQAAEVADDEDEVAGEAALVAEAVLTTEAAQPAEVDGTHLDPRKRYEWLTETRSLIDAGKVIALPVRELIARWETPTSYPKVEADLANHGIVTVPNFRKVSLETIVRLASSEDVADSSPDDETQPDFGLTVGNLPSALSGVKSVSPNATFEEALTVMALNRYDQLAVLAGPHNLRGAVTWESIAWARHANADPPFSQAIIEAQEARYDQDLVEALPKLDDSGFVFVRNDHNEVAGIITTADVVATYGETATPFILIGQLDQVLRRLIRRIVTLDETQALCDPEHRRDLDSYDKLELGDYQRVLENPEYWKRLKSPFDRVAFIQRLNELRLIRNNIMHFNPEPLDPQTTPKLRNMLRVLRAFEGH
jgi:CBS domain-containing protein